MTAHQLAQKLLTGPDLPVVINGWGSDEGFTIEVTGATKPFMESALIRSQSGAGRVYGPPTEVIALTYED